MTQPRSNPKLVAANSASEFRSELEKLDTHVPSRAEKRTSEHVERFTIARLLATLPLERFDYPLLIEHDDKPDFRLTMGSRTVGIEHTEGITENEAHAQALRAKGYGADFHFLPHAKVGETKKSRQQLIAEIRSDEPSEPWIGDSPEHEWAEFMVHFLQEKAVAFRKPEFEKLSQNWLLIYDNLPLPALDQEKASTLLFNALSAADGFADFDHVFIVSGEILYEFSNGRKLVHRNAKRNSS